MNQDMNTSIKPSKADLNGINRQMKKQFYKAFRDLLKERVCENPPDYKWIVKLYDEIKTRLCTILKKGSQKREEIEEKMDVELFEQIIKNGAFTGKDMHGLVNYVFDKCMELQSKERDEYTIEKRNELLAMMVNENCTFADILPEFILSANQCIDYIYIDLHNFLNLGNSIGD